MGRRKRFDPQDAKEAMKQIFWQQGYEGTSLQDLERVTALPKQSLYREFGDKRGMYLAALSAYEAEEVRAASRILRAHSDPKQAFAALFDAVLRPVEEQDDRRGCFLCNAASDRTTIEPAIDTWVNAAMVRMLATFTAALGDTDKGDQKARALLAGYVGIRVLARSGLPTPDLRMAANRLIESTR
ncbi:TetR/AcrR family transcriptional regulator [Aurantiacibacter sp. D1-12]|uniref:TetR/AcrR family transcriptional regulator n=1 Tax=Aurantiacibacter sp. D1-12 TaxID=2993658 RepID=UPI00237C69CC|nr:TetR/AcrR family transcriptional regulator [Aurantiacibacter sp. D1-12]MDE1466984.1 TetR/AcrR family transcriptional regulator [Aurantiacibacter sp. D1-12]